MRPTQQTRTGENGNCFAACLSSICEAPLPEFGIDVSEATYWANVDSWLAKRGLKYERVPIIKGLEPVGWSTIEGTSPRGGLHAVVGKNGLPWFDPHPQDGTGRGLTEPKWYGLLEPLTGEAKDAVKETDPNKIEVKFWKGESLKDWGFKLRQDKRGYNGNLPALYATGPDGRKWKFNGPMHYWALQR